MEGKRPARVFVSSTSGAMAPYREAALEVCRRLGLTAVHMEEFSPERLPPAEVCRREVESCDVLLLLLAHRYGNRPEGGGPSYTELEYRWALSRTDMAIIAFRVDPAFPWLPSDIDRGPDEQALTTFAEMVGQRHVVRPFGELTRFREDLIIALSSFKAVSVPAAVPITVVRAPAFHSVPAYVGSAPFTGRVADLEALDRWAASDDPMMVVDAIGGTGKSALTWEWATSRAPAAIDGLAGRIWWSFYDGSASMTRFLQEFLAYATGRPPAMIARFDHATLTAEVRALLRSRPYLLVLDGVERLLVAYQRIAPSHVADEDASALPYALSDARAYDILRDLATARPSRVLISTRLMPDALKTQFGRQVPGVAHIRLPGLSNDDTVALLRRLGVHGDPRAVTGFMSQLGNHPLLIGVVAGLINDYRPAPGSFERWRSDRAAGGSFRLEKLDLIQRRTHILAGALHQLGPDSRLVLGWTSQLEGSVDWATLEAINPFRGSDSAAEASAAALGRLDRALTDLEQRGLLWWDRRANLYDLHPIVRAFAHSQLDESSRVLANTRISAHFEAIPERETRQVSSIEEMRNSIGLFRALVGAARFYRASTLWRDVLQKPILLELGATGTAIELLSPLAEAGSPYDQTELAFALYQAGRYTEALEQDLLVVSSSVKSASLGYAHFENAIDDMLAVHRDAWAERYLALWDTWDHGRYSAKIRQKGILAAMRGDVAEARKRFVEANRIGPDVGTIWFYAHTRWWPHYLAMRVDGSLTEGDLDGADRIADSWLERLRLRTLRRELRMRNGQWQLALDVSFECDRMERAAAVDSVPAMTAYLLARMGRTAEAEAAMEETLSRLDRLEDAVRPHLAIGQALHALGRAREAKTHALEAYRQAWGDGPPYSRHWDLEDARILLRLLGLREPKIRIDPAALTAPHEDAIRKYIAKRRSARGL